VSARRVVKYRWFPAKEGCGLLGGVCADSKQEAREWGQENADCDWVRVRFEYCLPVKVKVSEG